MRSALRIALSVLLAGALVAALAAPASAATRTARRTTAASYAASVLAAVNRTRAAGHERGLRSNVHLAHSAAQHDRAMAAANLLSHQLVGEPLLTVRETLAGYLWCRAGENVAWTTDTTRSGALALERSMMNERPPNDLHRINMLSRSFRDIGVAVYFDKAHGKLWLTMDFGATC